MQTGGYIHVFHVNLQRDDPDQHDQEDGGVHLSYMPDHDRRAGLSNRVNR